MCSSYDGDDNNKKKGLKMKFTVRHTGGRGGEVLKINI